MDFFYDFGAQARRYRHKIGSKAEPSGVPIVATETARLRLLAGKILLVLK